MENNKITFTYKAHTKESIDSFLSILNYSPNNIYYLIKEGNVFINGNKVIDKTVLVNENDLITITLLSEKNDLEKTNKEIEIIYEDAYFLIVNKPYNVEVEPTINNNSDTLANYVSYYFFKNNINSKIHLVNRLDKLTSGLVIIAKNKYIHNLFSKIEITKKYKALVSGIINKSGIIDIKIKKEGNEVKRVISNDGKRSLTKYELIKIIDEDSLVDITLLTGRTHQIRLSLASINHPLVNDPLYGTIKNDKGMYLNSYYLKFIHPITTKEIEISL